MVQNLLDSTPVLRVHILFCSCCAWVNQSANNRDWFQSSVHLPFSQPPFHVCRFKSVFHIICFLDADFRGAWWRILSVANVFGRPISLQLMCWTFSHPLQGPCLKFRTWWERLSVQLYLDGAVSSHKSITQRSLLSLSATWEGRENIRMVDFTDLTVQKDTYCLSLRANGSVRVSIYDY